jgi:hypothetical protein
VKQHPTHLVIQPDSVTGERLGKPSQSSEKSTLDGIVLQLGALG